MSSNLARSLLFLSSVLAIALKTPARGDMIEFTFEGTIEQAFGEGVEPWGQPAPGTPVSLRYVFDDEAIDQNPIPARGTYDAVVSGSLTIGDESAPILGGEILVFWGSCETGCPPYVAGGYDVFADLYHGVVTQVTIGFPYQLGPVDQLPTDLDIRSALFGGPHLTIDAPNGGMVGAMSDFSRRVVPEPGAGVLLAMILIRLCTQRSIARTKGSFPPPPSRDH